MYNRDKFHLYSISVCQVKKFEMFLWQWSIHEMAHFWAFLGPNSPKYGLILLKFAPQLLFMGSKTVFEEFFENSNFYRNRTYPKFALFFSFCPTLRLFFSMKEAEIDKTKMLGGPNYAIGLSKNHKIKALSCPNFSRKIRLLLSYFGRFLVKKGAWSHFKGLELKFDLPYCSLTIVGHVSVQKVWFQHFPVLRL